MVQVIQEVPDRGWSCSKDELDAFESQEHSSWIKFTVIREACCQYGQKYAGWILPEDMHGTAYLGGWFAGRRSRFALQLKKQRARRSASSVRSVPYKPVFSETA